MIYGKNNVEIKKIISNFQNIKKVYEGNRLIHEFLSNVTQPNTTFDQINQDFISYIDNMNDICYYICVIAPNYMQAGTTLLRMFNGVMSPEPNTYGPDMQTADVFFNTNKKILKGLIDAKMQMPQFYYQNFLNAIIGKLVGHMIFTKPIKSLYRPQEDGLPKMHKDEALQYEQDMIAYRDQIILPFIDELKAFRKSAMDIDIDTAPREDIIALYKAYLFYYYTIPCFYRKYCTMKPNTFIQDYQYLSLYELTYMFHTSYLEPTNGTQKNNASYELGRKYLVNPILDNIEFFTMIDHGTATHNKFKAIEAKFMEDEEWKGYYHELTIQPFNVPFNAGYLGQNYIITPRGKENYDEATKTLYLHYSLNKDDNTTLESIIFHFKELTYTPLDLQFYNDFTIDESSAFNNSNYLAHVPVEGLLQINIDEYKPNNKNSNIKHSLYEGIYSHSQHYDAYKGYNPDVDNNGNTLLTIKPYLNGKDKETKTFGIEIFIDQTELELYPDEFNAERTLHLSMPGFKDTTYKFTIGNTAYVAADLIDKRAINFDESKADDLTDYFKYYAPFYKAEDELNNINDNLVIDTEVQKKDTTLIWKTLHSTSYDTNKKENIVKLYKYHRQLLRGIIEYKLSKYEAYHNTNINEALAFAAVYQIPLYPLTSHIKAYQEYNVGIQYKSKCVNIEKELIKFLNDIILPFIEELKILKQQILDIDVNTADYGTIYNLYKECIYYYLTIPNFNSKRYKYCYQPRNINDDNKFTTNGLSYKSLSGIYVDSYFAKNDPYKKYLTNNIDNETQLFNMFTYMYGKETYTKFKEIEAKFFELNGWSYTEVEITPHGQVVNMGQHGNVILPTHKYNYNPNTKHFTFIVNGLKQHTSRNACLKNPFIIKNTIYDKNQPTTSTFKSIIPLQNINEVIIKEFDYPTLTLQVDHDEYTNVFNTLHSAVDLDGHKLGPHKVMEANIIPNIIQPLSNKSAYLGGINFNVYWHLTGICAMSNVLPSGGLYKTKYYKYKIPYFPSQIGLTRHCVISMLGFKETEFTFSTQLLNYYEASYKI